MTDKNTEKQIDKQVETTTKSQVSKMTREEKLKLRREMNFTAGQLYLPEELRNDGNYYRTVNLTPGNLEKWQRMGAEVVNIESGADLLSHPEATKRETAFEVGGGRGSSLKAVWVRMNKEDREIMLELEKEKADNLESQILQEHLDPHSGQKLFDQSHIFGKITKGQ